MTPPILYSTSADGDMELSPRELFFAVFPPIMLPVFMAVADQTIVAAALPTIAGSLGDVEHVSWVVLSYLVANTVAAPVYGRLGDAFGRRRLMVVALAVFLLASILCAMAGSILSLTFARILQGVGGGGLMVLSQALIGEVVPPRQRGVFQGYLAAVIVCSSTFGPVAGGFLTQSFGWPAVFLVNLPLGILAVFLARRLPQRLASTAPLKFDLPGLLLFAAFIIPLLLCLEQAQSFDAAALPHMAAYLSVSIAALYLLLKQEARASQPLFPLRMLRQPGMWRANAMSACSGALLVSEITFLPIYLHVVNGASPGRIGLLMLPLTGTVGVGSLITGALISRTGRTALFPAIGQIVTALTLITLAVTARDLTAWQLSWTLAFVALFQGTAMPVAQIAAQTLAGPSMLGSAAAAVQLSRSVGSAIGVAIVGVVLFAILSNTGDQTASVFAEMVERGPSVLTLLPMDQQHTVSEATTGAFSGVFLTIGAFSCICAALAWTTPSRRLTS
jgi:EmrB/QacA subfamily drug resistance transporter